MKNTIALVIPTKPDEVGQYVISTKCGAAARTEKSIDIPPVISTERKRVEKSISKASE